MSNVSNSQQMPVFIGSYEQRWVPQLSVGDYVLFYINKRKHCLGRYGIIISTGEKQEKFKIYCCHLNETFIRARSSIAQCVSKGS